MPKHVDGIMGLLRKKLAKEKRQEERETFIEERRHAAKADKLTIRSERALACSNLAKMTLRKSFIRIRVANARRMRAYRKMYKYILEYYREKSRKLAEYRKSIGDIQGYYSIYLTKDGVVQKYITYKRYSHGALDKYNELLNEHNSSVVFPKTVSKYRYGIETHKYELVMVKRIEGDDDPVSMIRNKDGKFIEVRIENDDTHKIIKKDEWLIEEEFNVYGYNPLNDRKTFSFILENIILGHTDRYTRVMYMGNKVIHHYDDDLDIIKCKNNEQAEKLYEELEKHVDKKTYKTVLFMGKLTGTAKKWMIEEIMKKTGWKKRTCR